jgi:2-polyprenyl-3-methyl-5-hydroxy-6-metoxy-1,4-benzoquinol methylase
MEHVLHHEDAKVVITDGNARKTKIKVIMENDDIFIPFDSWETSYPIELIEKILYAKGPAYLCDEIMRDESPGYVEHSLRFDVLAYINPQEMNNKSVLDFGCGSGASTMVLSRMLPSAQITGVELEEDLLEIAKLRSVHYQVQHRTEFHLSPDGESLPENIGSFDYVFLNAVYEHLLPNERKTVLQLLWKHLRPGGLMFINNTPYRWFPIESHTTNGLIFINYMPDQLASLYARHFSKRDLANCDWQTLLRKGIRGASTNEICRLLNNDSYKPSVIEPTQLGLKDRIDIWYAATNKSKNLFLKKTFFYTVKLIKMSTGVTFLPYLALAILKSRE